MATPQFKGVNVEFYNEKIPLNLLRKVDSRSLVGLYTSELLLYVGFILILLNNLNVVAPGSYFGAFNWVTVAVFTIGLLINFLSIPYLYFSSFQNFKKENDFWDKETFWILPLFFFGTFFLYESKFQIATILLIISIILIAIVHFRFIKLSWQYVKKADQTLASHQQYFMTLKYLSVYYLLLLALLVSVDPLQKILIWIRVNF